MIAAPRRLLIVKPSSFGDIIHALPVLALVRGHWPQATIDWLVKEEWSELLRGQPALNEVLLLPKSAAAWPALANTLQQRRYDLVIDLQGLLRSGVASWLTRAPARVGFADSREGSRWCYTLRVETGSGVRHALDRNLDLLRQIGVPGNNFPTFPLPLAPAAEKWLEALWAKERLSGAGRPVVIHPAARWKTKRWPAERFAETAERLAGAHHVPIVLVGGSAETAQVSEVAQRVRCAVVDLSGTTSLLQLAALLRRAALVVSNDSGPMHLAAAVGAPVLGIFGPTDPQRVGPYGDGNVALKKPFACRGCRRQRCVQRHQCLTAITVDEVVATASMMLRRRTPHAQAAGLAAAAGIVP